MGISTFEAAMGILMAQGDGVRVRIADKDDLDLFGVADTGEPRLVFTGEAGESWRPFFEQHKDAVVDALRCRPPEGQ